MPHPMNTGFVKNAKTGQVITEHHIITVTCMVDGKIVMEAQWGRGISENPFLDLKIKGARRGDVIGIKWVDNLGYSNSADALIS